jgi:hypothetical protein
MSNRQLPKLGTLAVLGAAAGFALLSAGTADAHGFVGIGLGFPIYAPAPVYYPPPVVYAPPPAYAYAPYPYYPYRYYAPGYAYYPPVVGSINLGFGRGWGWGGWGRGGWSHHWR